jgi:hypothetical protein
MHQFKIDVNDNLFVKCGFESKRHSELVDAVHCSKKYSVDYRLIYLSEFYVKGVLKHWPALLLMRGKVAVPQVSIFFSLFFQWAIQILASFVIAQ